MNIFYKERASEKAVIQKGKKVWGCCKMQEKRKRRQYLLILLTFLIPFFDLRNGKNILS